MISAVVLTKNEEKNIAACLRSLAWCDEIIVVDDYSTDGTIREIEGLGSKRIVGFQHNLNADFAQARNFGLEKAKHEWVLFIDADERVTSSLQFEIVSSINSSIENCSGYYIKRTDVLWGKELHFGEAGNTALLRLAKRDVGRWKGSVHEVWEFKGKTRTLKNVLEHYPHQSVSEFLSEINFYTDLRAAELFQKRKRATLLSIALYPIGKFLQNYFFKQGYRDGNPGLIVSLIMSFHSFLVRGKLWSLWQKNN